MEKKKCQTWNFKGLDYEKYRNFVYQVCEA